MIFARLLVRVVAFVLLIVLALTGLVFAVGAIDPAGIAAPLRLAELRDTVGGFLDDLEADGGIAVATALGAAGAILLGLLLLLGLLVPRRERLVRLEESEHGTLAARRRPLGLVATHLAEQARGVTDARAKVKPRRRAGGRLTVRADRPRSTSSKEAHAAITENLETLTGPFKLKAAVRTRLGERGSRVQ